MNFMAQKIEKQTDGKLPEIEFYVSLEEAIYITVQRLIDCAVNWHLLCFGKFGKDLAEIVISEEESNGRFCRRIHLQKRNDLDERTDVLKVDASFEKIPSFLIVETTKKENWDKTIEHEQRADKQYMVISDKEDVEDFLVC